MRSNWRRRSFPCPVSVTSSRVRQVPAPGRPWRPHLRQSPVGFLTEPATRAVAPAAAAVGEGPRGPRAPREGRAQGRRRRAGRDLYRRTPVPSLAPAGASRLDSPPPMPHPINAWHRLSNRLTNAAPPIAGRPGRALSYQASLRASCQFEVIETLPAPGARPRVARLAGAPRRVQVVYLNREIVVQRIKCSSTEVYIFPLRPVLTLRGKSLCLFSSY